MICYTVSKYNEKVDNHNEWTDYSDIGKVFDGKELTMEDYLSVEQKYIDFIRDVLDVGNISVLVLTEFEIHEDIKWKENQTIKASEAPEVIKDILRNRFWCKFKSTDLCLCFGFDFYMHVKTNVNYGSLLELCNKYGLYIKENSR